MGKGAFLFVIIVLSKEGWSKEGWLPMRTDSVRTHFRAPPSLLLPLPMPLLYTPPVDNSSHLNRTPGMGPPLH